MTGVSVYFRRAFLMYPYFAMCWDCGAIGKPARVKKKARKLMKCKCKGAK